ncbi:chemotaxis protein CheW [bacterium]|nr:chemotaxis protein CheW [bacterium]
MKEARRLHSVPSTPNEKPIQVVIFQIAERKFGIHATKILEIIFHQQILPLPVPKQLFEGIINLRGHVIPIAHALRRFGLNPRNPIENCSIVIIDILGNEVGIITDQVDPTLLQVNSHDFEKNEVSYLSEDPISGVLINHGEKIEVLDPDRLLSQEEIRELEKIKESF